MSTFGSLDFGENEVGADKAERLVSFEGKTGPYMQYACARIASILAKAEERGDKAGAVVVGHATERAPST